MLLEIEATDNRKNMIDLINGIDVKYLDDEQEDFVLCKFIDEVKSEEKVAINEFLEYLRK